MILFPCILTLDVKSILKLLRYGDDRYVNKIKYQVYYYTAKNNVISPDFLVWKFCRKTIRPKLCGNCAFPQSFHTRKSDEITIFFPVLALSNHLLWYGCMKEKEIQLSYLSEISNYLS